MTGYTRVNVASETNRAEVVVPNAEPIGSVLPQLLSMLSQPSSTVERPVTLVGADGDEVDLTKTPAELGLDDGSLLRLTHRDSAPPPPVVIDVADATAERQEDRADRWSPCARNVLTAAIAGTVSAYVGSSTPLSAQTLLWCVLGALVLAIATALTTGLMRRTELATLSGAVAVGLALPLTNLLGANLPLLQAGPLAYLGLLVLVFSVVLLLAFGIARKHTGATVGAIIGIATSSLQLGLALSGMEPVRVSTITGIIAIALIGVLPWISLSASGLNTLDARIADRERVERDVARASVDAAYSTLTWGVVALTISVVTAAVMLVPAHELWSTMLAIALALVLALRSRSFPTTPAKVVLLIGAVLILLAMALSYQRDFGAWLGVIGAVAVLCIAAIGLIQPRPHVRARLRGWGNLIESLAVVALVPLALGVWHVYQDLLVLFTTPAS